MELNVLNEQGQESAKLAASDTVFGREYNEALVHQLVVAYQANARQGTRAQLNRRDVHHTTKKPWRQKGTGRARSGMSSSPLWRGGGRTRIRRMKTSPRRSTRRPIVPPCRRSFPSSLPTVALL